jgi:hypothetical protein
MGKNACVTIVHAMYKPLELHVGVVYPLHLGCLAPPAHPPSDLHLGQPLSGDSLLAKLLLGGRYEEALEVAHAVWAPGSTPLLAALARTVSALAGAAARLQLQQASAGGVCSMCHHTWPLCFTIPWLDPNGC